MNAHNFNRAARKTMSRELALVAACDLLESASYEELKYLAPIFGASALNRRRLTERDELLRKLAERFSGNGNEILRHVLKELTRYANSKWKFDRERASPHDAKDALVHAILKLNKGMIPSRSTLWRALSGTPTISKKVLEMKRQPAQAKSVIHDERESERSKDHHGSL